MIISISIIIIIFLTSAHYKRHLWKWREIYWERKKLRFMFPKLFKTNYIIIIDTTIFKVHNSQFENNPRCQTPSVCSNYCRHLNSIESNQPRQRIGKLCLSSLVYLKARNRNGFSFCCTTKYVDMSVEIHKVDKTLRYINYTYIYNLHFSEIPQSKYTHF